MTGDDVRTIFTALSAIISTGALIWAVHSYVANSRTQELNLQLNFDVEQPLSPAVTNLRDAVSVLFDDIYSDVDRADFNSALIKFDRGFERRIGIALLEIREAIQSLHQTYGSQEKILLRTSGPAQIGEPPLSNAIQAIDDRMDEIYESFFNVRARLEDHNPDLNFSDVVRTCRDMEQKSYSFVHEMRTRLTMGRSRSSLIDRD